ncbi:hypothetical protein FH972_015754 [Carpinus fangiana]|uniref:Chromatin structure-remodeling complex protein BSH n=1 Tax=Carpinus fangiana TaxID=176857 RepID=A0A5N6REX2_9ROSI|nr:hypothetical protein FH972_015754 [Carpinus fangiana]
MKAPGSTSYKAPVRFRMPTAENLVPIRLDIEIDGQRFKDAFTWNPSDPDSEVAVFAKRTVRDLKLPPAFITQIASSIQSQLAEFRSLEGQDMYTGEKIVPIKLDLRVNHTLIKDQFLWDLNNFESDPEEFARTFCRDQGIEDPEVGPAIAFAIREQLFEIAIQNVASARESRISKKGRRGAEHAPASKAGGAVLDLVKLFGHKSSVVRQLWIEISYQEAVAVGDPILAAEVGRRSLMEVYAGEDFRVDLDLLESSKNILVQGKEREGQQSNTTDKNTASEGIVEIFEEAIKAHPQAIEHVSENAENILHVAIKYRQMEIFRRVKKMTKIRDCRLASRIDNRAYTVVNTWIARRPSPKYVALLDVGVERSERGVV